MLYDGGEREDGTVVEIFIVNVGEVKTPGSTALAAHL